MSLLIWFGVLGWYKNLRVLVRRNYTLLNTIIFQSRMTFDSQKTTALGKQDKSKKGGVDAAIIPLLNAINMHPDFYTTS